MKIKPSSETYAQMSILGICVVAFWALLIYWMITGAYVISLMAIPVWTVITFYTIGSICLLWKTVELCPEGYWVSFCGVRRLYRWDSVKTKRLEDYTDVWARHFDNSRFPEGALFSLDNKKRPKWMHPSVFCSMTHPFSSFYVSFLAQGEKWPGQWWQREEYVVVDKKQLLDTLHAYGIELD